MVYVDTNVLIYISVNQGEEKQKKLQSWYGS